MTNDDHSTGDDAAADTTAPTPAPAAAASPPPPPPGPAAAVADRPAPTISAADLEMASAVPAVADLPGVTATVPAGYTLHAQPTAGGGVGRRVGKTRNPWGVWLLSFVTLGIYMIWWYYKVNSEVREYDQTVDVQPGIAALALFVPIAGLVSLVKTGGRIARAQRTSGSQNRCSGFIGFILLYLLGTWVVYYQSQLNKVWDMHGNPVEGTRV